MALLVTGIFYQVAVRGRDDRPALLAAAREVVVAAKDLKVGAAIGSQDLRMEEWPGNRIPPGAFEDITEVIGRVTVRRVLVQEPIVDRRLAPPGSGVGLSPKVPPGMRAMAVRVDDVNGVAGFVLPEARVDVLLTGHLTGGGPGTRLTKTILSNVRVMSAGEHLTPDSSGRPQRVPVVTLLLSPEQAELLTLAKTHGRIQLVLRNVMDEAPTKTKGVREPDLFALDFKPVLQPRPARPAPPAVIRTPPPPRRQVEVIRGSRKSVQSFSAGASRK